MPNYCHNRLRIRGANEELQKLVVAVADAESDDPADRFSYEAILPIEDEEDEYDAWGSSSVYCLKVNANPDEVVYEFESSWDPPLAVIEYLASLWPSLEFEFVYVEPLTLRYGAHTYLSGRQRCWADAGISGWGESGLFGDAERWMRAFLEYAWPALAAKWWPGDAEAAA
jgi:hypothetical protein